jgi:hypothetical protein
MNENLQKLTEVIETRGPIKAARVSCTRTGSACPYSYWDAVRYQIRLARDGRPINVALERAGFGRRSTRLVERDLEELCEKEGRVELNRIGHLSDLDAELVLKQLG